MFLAVLRVLLLSWICKIFHAVLSPLRFVEVRVTDLPKFSQEIEFMGDIEMKPCGYPWRTAQEVKVQPSCKKKKHARVALRANWLVLRVLDRWGGTVGANRG